MKTRLKIIKLCILSALISTCLLGIAFSSYDETDVSSGSCSDGHNRDWITITTNYTGDSVSISQGQTFDLEITASEQLTGDVWIGYAFWHTASDGIQLPDTSPFIVEDYLVNEWNDGEDYYAQFAWQTVVNPMTRIFRINTTCLGGAETLIIQVAGEGTGPNERYSNVIDFNINVLEFDAPLVTITSPFNDSFVEGSSVLITATADDGIGFGVDSVWAEISNATYLETVFLAGIEPNYNATWDSTVVADGTYNLTIKANDTQTPTNVNDTESITIIVDNNAPSIIINTPKLGSSSSNSPNFELTISDTIISTTWYSIFDGDQWSENITFSGTTGTISQTLWDSVSNGELIIRFYAIDSLGNVAYAEISFTKEEVEENEPIPRILLRGEQFLTILIIAGLVPSGVTVGLTMQIKRKRSLKKRSLKAPDNLYDSAYYKYYGKKPRKYEF